MTVTTHTLTPSLARIDQANGVGRAEAAPVVSLPRSRCPRCGRKLRLHRDGIFQWAVCPAFRACGWTVFTHGEHPRDAALADAGEIL